MFFLTQIYSHTFISINLENFLNYSQVKIRVNYRFSEWCKSIMNLHVINI